MLKTIVTLKRNPNMTLEEFSEYWEKKHAPLVTRLCPNMKRYVQNHRCGLQIPPESPLVDKVGEDAFRTDPDIDGVVEAYFDDLESWYEAHNIWRLSDAGREWRDDEAKFLDMSAARLFIGREVVIK